MDGHRRSRRQQVDTSWARLCERRGYDPARVIAIGDFYNDLDMLRWAGLGAGDGRLPSWSSTPLTW